eukprot:3121319-Rhodomonas_salina.1
MSGAMLPLGVLCSFHAPKPGRVQVHRDPISAQSENAVVSGDFRCNIRSGVRQTSNWGHSACTSLDQRSPPFNSCLRDRTGSA